jgi:hypothetical protein
MLTISTNRHSNIAGMKRNLKQQTVLLANESRNDQISIGQCAAEA